MPPRSSPSITSTTKRAKCLCGSHSSTDGGRRNAVWRSTSRKLLIASKPSFGANQWQDFSENQRRWVKSDRLLDPTVKTPLRPGTFDISPVETGAALGGERSECRDAAAVTFDKMGALSKVWLSPRLTRPNNAASVPAARANPA